MCGRLNSTAGMVNGILICQIICSSTIPTVTLAGSKRRPITWHLQKSGSKTKADTVAAEIKDLLKEHGNDKIGEVTLSQIYQGMRGITGLVSETSFAGRAGGDTVSRLFDT
jgi:hypothetical protein